MAPLDVLVTRDEATGNNTFHIIEINGTGISGLTNMPDDVVSELDWRECALLLHLLLILRK